MRKKALQIVLVLAPIVAAIAAPAQGASTNVDLRDLVACKPKKVTKANARTVTVRWRTGSEAQLLGFNLYRQVGTKLTKVNRSVIGSKGQLGGATYKVVDRLPKTVRANPCYRLEGVGTQGDKRLLRKVCARKCVIPPL
jgi:hypothetical protein